MSTAVENSQPQSGVHSIPSSEQKYHSYEMHLFISYSSTFQNHISSSVKIKCGRIKVLRITRRSFLLHYESKWLWTINFSSFLVQGHCTSSGVDVTDNRPLYSTGGTGYPTLSWKYETIKIVWSEHNSLLFNFEFPSVLLVTATNTHFRSGKTIRKWHRVQYSKVCRMQYSARGNKTRNKMSTAGTRFFFPKKKRNKTCASLVGKFNEAFDV